MTETKETDQREKDFLEACEKAKEEIGGGVSDDDVNAVNELRKRCEKEVREQIPEQHPIFDLMVNARFTSYSLLFAKVDPSKLFQDILREAKTPSQILRVMTTIVLMMPTLTMASDEIDPDHKVFNSTTKAIINAVTEKMLALHLEEDSVLKKEINDLLKSFKRQEGTPH